ILGRGGAQLFVKSEKSIVPLPNPKRHPSMRWDAYVYASDPDALAAEFTKLGATFSIPLADTHDGLRGFEICDPDGYVIFFGRPRQELRRTHALPRTYSSRYTGVTLLLITSSSTSILPGISPS